jgi:6-pyruvoyltetrahydropterin/6-carboxytetrahydropterin synthase
LKENRIFYITKSFTFDSAHNLVHYKGKCEKLHGHTYRLDVTVKGKLDEDDMVIDFIDLKNIVKANVLKFLDHSYLNDLIEQPSAENIVFWIWSKLEPLLKTDAYSLYELKLWETPTSFVTFRGETDERYPE